MSAIRSFFGKPNNRKLLKFLWVVVAVPVIAGLWELVKYVWPVHDAASTVCAQQGGIAAGHDATGNTVIFNGHSQTEKGVALCGNAPGK